MKFTKGDQTNKNKHSLEFIICSYLNTLGKYSLKLNYANNHEKKSIIDRDHYLSMLNIYIKYFAINK